MKNKIPILSMEGMKPIGKAIVQDGTIYCKFNTKKDAERAMKLYYNTLTNGL